MVSKKRHVLTTSLFSLPFQDSHNTRLNARRGITNTDSKESV